MSSRQLQSGPVISIRIQDIERPSKCVKPIFAGWLKQLYTLPWALGIGKGMSRHYGPTSFRVPTQELGRSSSPKMLPEMHIERMHTYELQSSDITIDTSQENRASSLILWWVKWGSMYRHAWIQIPVHAELEWWGGTGKAGADLPTSIASWHVPARRRQGFRQQNA